MNHLFLGFIMLLEIMTKPFDTDFSVFCYLGSAGMVVCCAMIGAVTDMINPKRFILVCSRRRAHRATGSNRRNAHRVT